MKNKGVKRKDADLKVAEVPINDKQPIIISILPLFIMH
jgi:hypothetical protein